MRWAQIVLFLAILTAAGGLYWRMVYLEAQNDKLTTALENANKTITALDEVAKKHTQIRETEGKLIDEIDAAPQEHDGRTAPVLLDAINRLR